MKKAFDSVSKEGLIRSLRRIGTPHTFNRLIENLCSDRTGRVLINREYTEEFEVHGGIDQGDTLSPLLWRIFYDPLVTEINENGGKYKMEVQWQQDLRIERIESLTKEIAALVYMDDTTWIADSREGLQNTLDIADSFFRLNDIEINTGKTKLIALHQRDTEGTVEMNGEEIHQIGKEESIRLLGIWINSRGNKIDQRMRIERLVNLSTRHIQRSRITMNMTRYLLNQVVFPGIEYLMTDTILKEKEMSRIQRRIQGTFKGKVELSRMTPDCMIRMREGFNVFGVEERQIKNTMKRLQRVLEDEGDMGDTSRIRMRQIQNKSWTASSIMEGGLLEPNRQRHNQYLRDAIRLLRSIDLKIGSEHKDMRLQTIGGSLPIEDILGDEYISHRENLRRWNIMFLEQLLEPKTKRLLEWEEVFTSPKHILKRAEPGWYNKVRDTVTSEDRGLTDTWRILTQDPITLRPTNKRRDPRDI